MKITKALITLADPNKLNLPLQTLIDQSGKQCSALELILTETLSAGIEEICAIVCPNTSKSYIEAAGALANRIHFIEQPTPNGYSQAILLAESFIGAQPFLHLVGDHLCVSRDGVRCARQVVEVASRYNASVSSVQSTNESQISSFGTIGGNLLERFDKIYQVDRVLEKPSPTQAELDLRVPGLRSGYYLCFFGIHVLQPSIFGILKETTQLEGPKGRSLSTALDILAKREKLLAVEVSGQRYDIGSDYGLLFAQLALSFSGKDRDQVVTGILEMLATKQNSKAVK